MSKTVEVAAAVIERSGEVLISTRPGGGELAGLWEFPGGKLEAGESAAEALRRELDEELSLSGVRVLDTLYVLEHERSGKRLRIVFMRCRLASGASPVPREGQECRWIGRDRLAEVDFLPADAGFVRILAQ